jgi:uncharacterized protein (DUF1800 family)
MVSRRDFLRIGGGATLVAAAGCNRLPQELLPWLNDDSRPVGPFAPPSASDVDVVTHVLNRLTFGARPGDYARVRALAPQPEHALDRFVAEQLDPERIDDRRCDRMVRRLEAIHAPPGELFEYKPRYLLTEMTRGAVLRATLSERQLYEVMVGFWTDHFNIDVSKGDCRWLKAADDRLVIRAHALGRFPHLLRATATSPAMLWYLDGRTNRKASPAERPNENYARELLELHTLGVGGGYTQRDVMEVARCLTGWTVRSAEAFRKGVVEFRPELHDDGPKEVLGRSIPAGLGPADLDAVLGIVALHPSTARHLATKLCRRFISDAPPATAIRATAAAFVGSGGDIRATLRALFATPEFVSARGSKLKRPFEYVVSALRATAARTDAGETLTAYLTQMGHSPFQYPTPEGYADEESPWLGTLLWRWDFAAALAQGRLTGTRVDVPGLRRALGGDDGLMAHLLGRRATADESKAYREVGGGALGLALLLASPAFQRA